MAMVRYLIMRTMIFIGCLSVVWLLGLRDRSQQPLAVVIAALASLAISFVVLKPFRERASADIATRVDRRLERKRDEGADEVAEDAEIDRPAVPEQAQTAESNAPVESAAHDKGAGSDSDFR